MNSLYYKLGEWFFRKTGTRIDYKILDRHFLVRRGTETRKLDYDDAWMMALAKRSQIIFDIGCNVGHSALLMNYFGPKQMVLVDPNPEALSMAADNLIHNSFDTHIHYVCAFSSDKEDKEMNFYALGAGAAGSGYKEQATSASRENAYFRVRTTTMDRLMKKFNLIPDFIKMDVEGAEFDTLMGGKELLAHKKSILLVEMHSNEKMSMKSNARQVIDFCSGIGYEAWYMKHHEKISDPSVVEGRGRCHFLLQPQGWEYPEYLKDLEQGAVLEKVK